MKNNKKASEKTVETSIIGEPLAPPSMQVRTQHIPPIELSSGSLILDTGDGLNNNSSASSPGGYHIKHVFARSNKIGYVRVIMFDNSLPSMIDVDYTHTDPSGPGGKIEIWVKQPTAPNANIVIQPGNSGKLQIEIDNNDHIFHADGVGGAPGHERHRWAYKEPNARLLKVRVSKVGGSDQRVSTGTIVLVQIWPDGIAPHIAESPHDKPM